MPEQFRRVTVPGHGTLRFPADATDEEIDAEVQRLDGGSTATEAPLTLEAHRGTPAMDMMAADPADPRSYDPALGRVRGFDPAKNILANAALAGQFGGNVAKSAGRFARDAITPALHPIDTAAGVASAVSHPIDTANAVGGYVADRYGSYDRAKSTFWTDPVGAVADAATALSAGGAAAAKAPGALGKVGRFAAAAGELADPGRAAVAAARVVLPGEAGLTDAARRASSSALKVKDSLSRRNPGVDIPLEAAKQGARVSQRSADTLGADISRLKGDVTREIAASPATILPSEAAREARDLLRQRKSLGGVAASDVEQIREEIRHFVDGNAPMPAEQMQQVKEFLGDKLKAKFGAETTPAKVDAQKALRAGARRSLEKAVPAVTAPNAEMRRKIPVRQAVADAVKRTEKWDVAQVVKLAAGAPVGGALGFAVGGASGAGLGAPIMYGLVRALDNPSNKMRIASALYKAGKIAQPTGDLATALAPLLTKLSTVERIADADLTTEEADTALLVLGALDEQPRNGILPPLRPSADADQQAARPAPPIRLAVSHSRDEDEPRSGRGVLPPLRQRQAGKAPSPAPLRPR